MSCHEPRGRRGCGGHGLWWPVLRARFRLGESLKAPGYLARVCVEEEIILVLEDLWHCAIFGDKILNFVRQRFGKTFFAFRDIHVLRGAAAYFVSGDCLGFVKRKTHVTDVESNCGDSKYVKGEFVSGGNDGRVGLPKSFANSVEFFGQP